MPDLLSEGQLLTLEVKTQKHEFFIEGSEVGEVQSLSKLILGEIFFQLIKSRFGFFIFLDKSEAFRALALQLEVLLVDFLKVSQESRHLIIILLHIFLYTAVSLEFRVLLNHIHNEGIAAFGLDYLGLAGRDELEIFLHLF